MVHYPETAEYTSCRGRVVSLQRRHVPEAPKTQEVHIKYHTGGIGREVWYPDVPRCWRAIHRKLEWFLKDCDSLGRLIKEQ
jgi:hypothetical protein